MNIEYKGHTIELNPTSYIIWKENNGGFLRVHNASSSKAKPNQFNFGHTANRRFTNSDEALLDAKYFIDNIKAQ